MASSLVLASCVTLSVGGLAYVFLYPYLSGNALSEKRQKALAKPAAISVAARPQAAGSRRDQVAQSLKDIEDREKKRLKVPLDVRIAQAGLTWSKTRFLLASAVCGCLLAVVFLLISGSLYGSAAGLFIGGFGLPRWILTFRRKRRINRFINEFPNAMDVIVRGIKAGLPLGDCMRIIATEAAEPVRSEFRHVIETQTLGIPLNEAVERLYQRVPVAESNFFGIVIAIQQKAGGNLAEALTNLSRVLRERRKMKGKIAAMSMEAKASAAIIAALPFIVAFVVYITSPNYIELLWTTRAGQFYTLLSAVWMVLGVLTMKKMIAFDF